MIHVSACSSCHFCCSQDKAIKRFIVRNIVDASAIRDIQDSCVYDGYALPKIYRKVRSARGVAPASMQCGIAPTSPIGPQQN
jgi:ribosomal protein S26